MKLGEGQEFGGGCSFESPAAAGVTAVPHQTGKVLSVKVSLEKRCLRVLQVQALEVREQAMRVFLSPEQ